VSFLLAIDVGKASAKVRLCGRPLSSYGSLMLGTNTVGIDYLDIVPVRRAPSFVETKPVWLRCRGAVQ